MRVTRRDPSNGILDFPKGLGRFTLHRLPPAEGLRPWIETYWVVAWRLKEGESHQQTNVSHASANVALEPEGAFLYGVPGRIFERNLTGAGEVFGIKFRPGGFFPFYGTALKGLLGRRIPLESVFGDRARRWVRDMHRAETASECAAVTNAFWQSLRDGSPARFRTGPTRATLVAERIIADRSLLAAADAARAVGMELRSLQRLFRRQVGISPKEMILRFRLQEAAERLLREPGLRSSELALDLGYFDQAHFTRDFKSVTGVSPEAYQLRQKRA